MTETAAAETEAETEAQDEGAGQPPHAGGEAAELVRLAAVLREHQRAVGATDAAWCRRHPGLGSTKTYVRICRGETGELDHARWLADYRAVLALLDAVAGAGEQEEIYADLGPALALRAAVTGAMRECSNRRLVLMVAEPGMGKTSAARAVRERYGARVALSEADETWKDSPGAMLTGLGSDLGLRGMPVGLGARVDAVCRKLAETRTCLIIDEAHHLGPRTLNLVKTLLNRTPGEFVFLCLPTLWRRLETTAYDEARQLTTNRLHERISPGAISPDDAARLIGRRCGELGGGLKEAAALALRDAVRRGGYSWVAAACREALRLAAGEPGGMDLETFARGVSRAEALRGHTSGN